MNKDKNDVSPIKSLEETMEKRVTVDELRRLWPRPPKLDPEDAALFEEQLKEIRRSAVMPPSPWDKNEL